MRTLIICLAVLFATAAHAGEAEKLALAKRLIEVSQAEVLTRQMNDSLTTPIMQLAVQQNPQLSDEQKSDIVRILSEEIDAAIPEILDKTAEIYAQRFEEHELQEILDFHLSPTGQKVIQSLPGIMNEGMAHGMQVGEKIAQRAFTRYKSEGLI